MRKKLADLIFPSINNTTEFYLNKYPQRQLKKENAVTRYAPSPTGFQHIGGVFAALVSERLANLSDGVFYLRIEDTDQKREIKGAIKDTIDTMNNFGISFKEGMVDENNEIGQYGPYRQSLRSDIYNAFAKELVIEGKAYPCFCTTEDLNQLREGQIEGKITTGYYGKYAKCRDISPEDSIDRINNGEKYVLRFKSPAIEGEEKRVEFHDLIKGDLSFPENNQDIVLIKSDGLPTYHFAHVLDDKLMGTTHVTRGEEWLSSLPIHVQLFEELGFTRPEYGHIPTVLKQEENSKRKLSKRKDPEAAVSFYKEVGYPEISVVEYLLNLMNSDYEQWRVDNPEKSYKEFPFDLNKMSKSGALFDLVKLNDVSKDIIASFTAEEMYERYTNWANEYDKEIYDLFTKHKEISLKIFAIDKGQTKPRKDYGKFADVKDKTFFFFDELFNKDENIELPNNLEMTEAKRIIALYKEKFNFNVDAEKWFADLKEVAIELGYCADRKEYKKNPENYKGMVSDVAGTVRGAITHRTNTPDLYTIIQILGEDVVKGRLESF